MRIETIHRGSNTVDIHTDEDCPSPRDPGDCLTTSIAIHRDGYGDQDLDLGDLRNDYDSEQDLRAAIEHQYHPVAIAPIYMMDHSGVSISTDPYGCPWDSGQCGWVYITPGHAEATGIDPERYEEAMRIEVQEYNLWLNAECYGYIVRDSSGVEVESCWGYIGFEYAKQEAIRATSITAPA